MSVNVVTEFEEFISEAKSNNYVEMEVDGEDVVLICDTGAFIPYMVVSENIHNSESNVDDVEQKLDDLLVDNGINFRGDYKVMFDENNTRNLSTGAIYHIDGARIPN